MSKKIDVAIVGYGNIGRGVQAAIGKTPDMGLTGVITRRPQDVRDVYGDGLIGVKIADANKTYRGYWNELRSVVDVAILCGGSKNDLPVQGPKFARFFNTVDSFDNHDKISMYHRRMHMASEPEGTLAVISAGWDPGTFSMERVLGEAFIPGSSPQGFYGLTIEGGLSMGHSDAIRKVEGVKDARQYTHAHSAAMEISRHHIVPKLGPAEKHWRDCFVVLENDTDDERGRVEGEIKKMPGYFEPYQTQVNFVDQKTLDENHSAMPHDGVVITSGETGKGNAASIEYKVQWKSNPEATAQILVACARAAHRMSQEGKSGAFTMLDIPPAYYSTHSRDELLKDFM